MCVPENVRHSPYVTATPRTAFPLPPVGDGAIDVPKKHTISPYETATNFFGIICRGGNRRLTTCYALRISISALKRTPFAVRNGCNLTAGARGYSPTVDISDVHLTTNPVGATLLLAEQVGSPENVRLSPYATATYCRCLCSFFPSGKKEPKKVLPSCAAATLSRGSMKPPAPLPLEIRCRLTRCTCISQNPAFAPRTAYRASYHGFQGGHGSDLSN